MLQVSDAAVSVLKQEILREGDPLQEDESKTAVRLQTAAASDGQQALSIQPVSGPLSGDAATEAEGLEVFVAPDIAAPLESAVLDARETPEGPQLFLREQSEAS
jgi:Fe-S cluster assembly iron-binding protein IscA